MKTNSRPVAWFTPDVHSPWMTHPTMWGFSLWPNNEPSFKSTQIFRPSQKFGSRRSRQDVNFFIESPSGLLQFTFFIGFSQIHETKTNTEHPQVNREDYRQILTNKALHYTVYKKVCVTIAYTFVHHWMLKYPCKQKEKREKKEIEKQTTSLMYYIYIRPPNFHIDVLLIYHSIAHPLIRGNLGHLIKPFHHWYSYLCFPMT